MLPIDIIDVHEILCNPNFHKHQENRGKLLSCILNIPLAPKDFSAYFEVQKIRFCNPIWNTFEMNKSDPKYRPDIDGLRAIAVLSVFLFHLNSSYAPGGFLGVDVFFVISGFVVSGALHGLKPDNTVHYLSLFYSRRLARLIPALMTMLLGTALLSVIFVPRAWLSLLSESTGSYAFWGLSNWLLERNTDSYFSPRSEFNPFTHTWSLGAEEQFYLIFPLIFFLWLSNREKKGPLATAGRLLLPTLTAISLAVCILWSSKRPDGAFYSILARFWEMGLGSILFQISLMQMRLSLPSFFKKNCSLIGLALLAIGFAFADGKHFPFPWALPVVLGTLLLIHGGQYQNSIQQILGSKLLVWIGLRSYSIYLWHWPLIVILRWTIGIESPGSQLGALITTFLLAELSYRFIETPLRHFQPSTYKLKRRIVAYLIFIGVSWSLYQKIYENQASLSANRVTREFRKWYPEVFAPKGPIDECRASYSYQSFPFGEMIQFQPKCRLDQKKTTVYVFGDSHAKAYAPLLLRTSSETPTTINLYTGGGCPYLDLRIPFSDRTDPACLGFWEKAQSDALEKIKPGDLLVLASLRMARFGDQWGYFADRNHNEMNHSPESLIKMARARDEAIEWLKPFSQKGARIVFEAPKPLFKSPYFRCAEWFNSTNPICAKGLTQERTYLENLRAPIVTSQLMLAASLPGLEVWDVFDILCPGETCLPQLGNQPLFFDGDHISGVGNDHIFPSFVSLIHEQKSHTPIQFGYFWNSTELTFKGWSEPQEGFREVIDPLAQIWLQIQDKAIYKGFMSLYLIKKPTDKPTHVTIKLNDRLIFEGPIDRSGPLDLNFSADWLSFGKNKLEISGTNDNFNIGISYLFIR